MTDREKEIFLARYLNLIESIEDDIAFLNRLNGTVKARQLAPTPTYHTNSSPVEDMILRRERVEKELDKKWDLYFQANRIVVDASSRLSRERQRQIFSMRYLLNKDIKEIATELKTGTQCILSTLKNAIRNLDLNKEGLEGLFQSKEYMIIN